MNLRPLLLIVVALSCWSVRAQVIYVDADAVGANDGSSWSDAYTELQNALGPAISGDEIWVAEGIYKPTNGNNRSISFELNSGVSLYGGFDGTEKLREERNWTENESILSGDIRIPGDSLDNSYNVITAISVDASTTLDDFTVQHGKAGNPTPPFDRGAGLYAPNSDIAVRNCFFRWNVASVAGGAQTGGGIYFENGSPIVEDCVFTYNVGGGAIFDSGGSPTILRVSVDHNIGQSLMFFDNSTAHMEDCWVELGQFAGTYVRDSSPTFLRCTFRQNIIDGGDGGGAAVDNGSFAVFEDCLFEGNWASSGAGVDLSGGSRALFINTTFRENVASSSGAVKVSLSEAVFLNCLFERNTGLGAGAIRTQGGSVTVVNTTFIGNRSMAGATDSGGLTITGSPWQGIPILIANSLFVGNEGQLGGAMIASGLNQGDARMINSTLVGNVASESGGALYALLGAGLSMQNVIFWGNEAPVSPEIHVAQGSPPEVQRAIVAGGFPSGTDVLDEDPLFVRTPDPGLDGQWGTADDDYGDLQLLQGSPGIDFGLASFLPADVWDLDDDGNTTEPLPIDLNGDVRVQGSNADLGVYEGPGIVADEVERPTLGDASLLVYPNPTSGLVTISNHIGGMIVIHDVLGRRVLEVLSDQETVEFDVSALPQGVYIIRTELTTELVTIRQ